VAEGLKSHDALDRETMSTLKTLVNNMGEAVKDEVDDLTAPSGVEAIIKDVAVDITGAVPRAERFSVVLPDARIPSGAGESGEAESVTASDVVRAALKDAGFEVEAEIERETGVAVLDIKGAGIKAPVFIKEVKVVPESMTDGLKVLRDGTVLSVKEGLGAVLAPAPRDPVAVETGLESLEGIDEVRLSPDGGVEVSLSNDVRVSAGFSYVLEPGEGQGSEAGATGASPVFTVEGSDPASPGFRVKVEYPDGAIQAIVPVPHAMDELMMELESAGIYDFVFDRATGVLNLPDIGAFKPDFTVEPLSGLDDYMQFNHSKNANGVMWETGDYNRDGLMDVKMWTKEGKQTFYKVP